MTEHNGDLLFKQRENDEPVESEFGEFAEISEAEENVQTEHETYMRVKNEYSDMLEKRDHVNRSGVVFIGASAVVFLALMFSLESKLIFLVLWIITIILSVAYLIHNEYKIYKLRLYLGYESEDEDAEEESDDELPEQRSDTENTAEIDITGENAGESEEEAK